MSDKPVKGNGELTSRAMIKGLAFMVSLAAIGWGLREADPSALLNKEWIDAAVRGKGLEGEALFLALAVATTAVGVPRQAIAFLGGYAFGFFLGTGLALLGAVGGCVAAFVYARAFGRDAVRKRFSGRIKAIDDFLRDNPFSMTLLIRFLPVGSNVATNLIAGVSSVRPVPFLAGSALGYLPQTIVFALLGGGIAKEGGFVEVIMSVALFVLSAALGIYLYRRVRPSKRIAGGTEVLDEPQDIDPPPQADEAEKKAKDDDPFA